MPLECHRVFYALLDNMTYVDQSVEGLGDYGMHIFLNVDVKKGIAAALGIGNHRTIDNVVAKLVKGEVLIKHHSIRNGRSAGFRTSRRCRRT